VVAGSVDAVTGTSEGRSSVRVHVRYAHGSFVDDG
jgi:hypothetical protein